MLHRSSEGSPASIHSASTPGEAVYNRAWILGDDKVISVNAQSRLDQITELIPVQVNAP